MGAFVPGGGRGHDLWSLPGVFITPHVAASTPVSRQRAARLVREQAEAYLGGEPLRNVISGAYQHGLS